MADHEALAWPDTVTLPELTERKATIPQLTIYVHMRYKKEDRPACKNKTEWLEEAVKCAGMALKIRTPWMPDDYQEWKVAQLARVPVGGTAEPPALALPVPAVPTPAVGADAHDEPLTLVPAAALAVPVALATALRVTCDYTETCTCGCRA